MENYLPQIFSLSNEISAIGNEDQLESFMTGSLNDLIPFTTAHILKIGRQKKTKETIYTYYSKKFVPDDLYVENKNVENKLESWAERAIEHGLIIHKGPNDFKPELSFTSHEIQVGNTKINDYIIIPLSDHSDSAIIIILSFADPIEFNADKQTLIDTLGRQLFLVLKNIQNSKDSNLKRVEDEFLSSLSAEISETKTKLQLSEVIYRNLKKSALGFDIYLTFINELDGTHTLALPDKHGYNYYSQIWSAHTFPLDDGFLDKLVTSKKPRELNISALNASAPPHSYFASWPSCGYQKMAVIPIYNNIGVFGFIFIMSPEPEDLLGTYQTLVKGITFQVSAINDVFIANEIINQKEEEKKILLSISNDFAMTRNKEDLTRVLLHKLKVLIPFSDFTLAIANKERNVHRLWITDFQPHRKLHKNFNFLLDLDFPIDDGLINEVYAATDPIVYQVANMAKRKDAPDYMHFFNETGAVELVGVSMKSGDLHLGGWFLISDKKGVFQKKELEIMKSISSQLSIATANILANERILKHENEKSQLLKLSNHITAFVSKHQLLHVLENELKLMIPFDYVMLFFHNEIGNELYLHSAKLKLEENPLLKRVETEYFPEDVTELLPLDDNGVIFNAEHIGSVKNQQTSLFELNAIREFVGVSLFDGDKVVGRFYLLAKNEHSYRKSQLGLIKGVSDKLSLAIKNIISNEEIVEKEQEKSILLNISNELSGIRNKNDMQLILQESLRKLFYYSHTVTGISDLIKQTYTGYLFDPNSASRSHKDYTHLFNSDHPINNPLIRLVLNAKTPVIFDLDELKSEDIPSWIKMNYESGLREMVMTELYVRNKHLGFFVIFSNKKGLISSKALKLIKGITSQVSIALANLIANEEIIEKENEKSILLELSSEIATVRNKSDLTFNINEKVKKLLPVSHFVINLFNDDLISYTPFLIDVNSVSKGHKDYAFAVRHENITGVALTKLGMMAEQPTAYDVHDWVGRPGFPDIIRVNIESGINQAVLSTLNDGRKKIGFIIFFNRNILPMTAGTINLIKGISAQLTTAIANIMSNEQIATQLEEISSYKRQLEEENLYLQEEIETTHNYSEIIGSDKSMATVFHLISQVAETSSSVLLLGETGTGKELIARALHNTSLRKDKLMVKVNCATLPANLIESELFGHERGSFTGATERRIGKFELANNGTIFLDEIGEMPLDLQVKLLRALQEKEIERVGGKSVIKVNVRVIAATNRNLKKEVQLGNFRSDLFFRLNVFPITLPPLRERKDDIPELAMHFLTKYAIKATKHDLKFSSRVIKQLVSYQWPGNVRELEHLIERSILLANGPVINQIDLPNPENEEQIQIPMNDRIRTIDEVEREHIIAVLKSCKGKVAGIGGAAQLLKIPATTLNSKIARLKINKGLMQVLPNT
ncbi:sigma-54-dependent Fis family transcriptional regulator [Mucilaginibacter polytrichastri]|uniref:Sigma-54 factor interaction domain-containing protein n=1 Tax=Mucilaginibacter polytrichastri TaxID=1302689 RepID=A0A1Q5ZY88_9SPHI|nr:sigma 54-interacting transcriptional regulator [Mucilaginibacter polytrichastri]OKS86709.1 hypothetical protein RG47T_2166 [Mucilaginibacter polytrichastri]SFS82505.1 Transcriptional regulator containing GAF, AAA-type ATPase, and DNA-binding Fis domains [Mucilaginibacter polytrichastri]